MQEFFKAKKKEIEEQDLPYLGSYQNRIVYDIVKGMTLAKPNTTWNDICGMDKEKYLIQQDAIMPIILSESKMEVSINSKDLFIFGPSGVGKTLLVQALVAQLKSPVFLIEAKDFVDTYKKQSVTVIKRIFTAASFCHRAIVLINDWDCFYPQAPRQGPTIENEIRAEISRQLINEDRKTSFFIVGVTSRPDDCKFSILNSRALTKIYIPPPNLETRQALLNKYLKGVSHNLTYADIKELVLRMDGFVSSDIIATINHACYEPMREAQKATHFRLINEKKQQKYEACNESQGEEMSFLDIPRENLKLRSLKFEDFEVAMKKVNIKGNAQEIYDCEEYSKRV